MCGLQIFTVICLFVGFFKDTSLKPFLLLLNPIVSQSAEEMLIAFERKEGGKEQLEEHPWSL